MINRSKDTIHIKLKFPADTGAVGTRTKLFIYIVSELDNDWPYAANWDYPTEKLKICEVCGGRVYSRPNFSPGELKTLIRQLNVPIKILRFAKESRCGDKEALKFKMFSRMNPPSEIKDWVVVCN